jgi:uncharacterized protein YkwD
VLSPRKLPATTVSAITCIAFALGLTSTPAAAHAADHTRPAHTSCTKGRARASRHTRAATRACSHKLRARGRHLAVTPSPNGDVAQSSTAASAAQTSLAARDATIARVLATPCQNTELTPVPSNLPLVRAAVLCLINRKRAENGEESLKANPELEWAAENHCEELVADDYFAHISPSGETPVDRIRDAGYIPSGNVGYVIGENLAWGTYQLSTPQAIVAAWIASPGHLANILESQYTETGIGVTPAVPSSLAENSPGATYAQEFGVIVE